MEGRTVIVCVRGPPGTKKEHQVRPDQSLQELAQIIYDEQKENKSLIEDLNDPVRTRMPDLRGVRRMSFLIGGGELSCEDHGTMKLG